MVQLHSSQLQPSNSGKSQLFGHMAQVFSPLMLTTLLGITGMVWLGEAVLRPSIAQAYTARVNITLDNQPNETYETLLRRAEAVARAATQRSFDADILVTAVSITITGQNDGLAAPILSIDVSRSQWKSRPDPRRWATYYRASQSLLRLNETSVPIASPAPAPTATPTAAPPSIIQPTNQPNPTGQPTPVPGSVPPGTPNPAAPNTPAGQPGNTLDGTAPANTSPGTTPTNTPTNTPTTPPPATTIPTTNTPTTPPPATTIPTTNTPTTPPPATTTPGTTTPATPATPTTTTPGS